MIGGKAGYVVAPEGRYFFISSLAYEVSILSDTMSVAAVAARLSLTESQVADIRHDLEKNGIRNLRVSPPEHSSAKASGARRIVVVVLAFAAILGIVGTLLWFKLVPPEVRGVTPYGMPGDGGIVGASWFLGFCALVATHEAGHLWACVTLGAKPRGVRIRRRALWFAFVSNVTDVWTLPRVDRAMVALAGPIMTLAFSGVLSMFTLAFPWGALAGVLSSLTYLSLLTVILTAMPLWKMDGYYVLSALVNVPNLERQAASRLLYAIRRRDSKVDALVFFGLAFAAGYLASSFLLLRGIVGAIRAGNLIAVLVPIVAVILLLAPHRGARIERGTA